VDGTSWVKCGPSPTRPRVRRTLGRSRGGGWRRYMRCRSRRGGGRSGRAGRPWSGDARPGPPRRGRRARRSPVRCPRRASGRHRSERPDSGGRGGCAEEVAELHDGPPISAARSGATASRLVAARGLPTHTPAPYQEFVAERTCDVNNLFTICSDIRWGRQPMFGSVRTLRYPDEGADDTVAGVGGRAGAAIRLADGPRPLANRRRHSCGVIIPQGMGGTG
jgi:hypothetical protein